MKVEAIPGAWRAGIEGPALEIANSNSRFIRVCAGPGTGKSFAMRCRVARLLEEGVDPEKILAVTFTRAAARDLRRELSKVEVKGADAIRASTLHSYCLSMLSEEQVLQATGRVPRILMDFEVPFLLHDLKRQGRTYDDNEKLLRAFGASWARFQDELPGRPGNEEDRQFQEDLIGWLRFHRGMMVDEIAPEALKYLRHNPLAPQRSEFSHILVDEYQDLNRANQLLIDVLGEIADIIVVGDEDQSIYATLQHAQPEGIRTFPDSHAGTLDFSLTECRRCPKRIVEIANALIVNNANRVTESIVTRPNNPDGEIDIIQWRSIQDEATGISMIVRQYIDEEHVDPGEVLVLTPRRLASYALRRAINAQGIAVHSYFFEEALDSAKAREQFTLLSLVANPEDAVSLRCWLGFGRRDRNVERHRRLRDYCYLHGERPFDVLRQVSKGALELKGIDQLVERFRLLEQLRADIGQLTGQALVDTLFPDGDDDLREIRISAIETVALVSAAITADELFDQLRIKILNPEPPPAGGAVRLMSLHSSKGLTAKLVIVTSCVEDWVPSSDSNVDGIAADRVLEEQRRVFYVALTRTTHKLVLSSFQWIAFTDAKLMGIKNYKRGALGLRVLPSRFLDELGREAPAARGG